MSAAAHSTRSAPSASSSASVAAAAACCSTAAECGGAGAESWALTLALSVHAIHINLISKGFKDYFSKYSSKEISYFTNGIDKDEITNWKWPY
jgi:hypothetical protein